MALKIRLRQQGRRNRLTYRLVVADSRLPRDGKYLEKIGHYDPQLQEDKDAVIVEERLEYWLDRGAVLSEKARSLVARKVPGVLKALHAKQEEKKKARAKKRKTAKK
ncbi:MAG: 30S ribosomal protein S16 [Chlamydiae bacterium]|nr:30S ribosomal protein S16 [Chlamydiota bacterium]